MNLVPWKYVESWTCTGCGECCKPFAVVLTMKEWVKMVQTFGVGVTVPRIDGFYLKKAPNDRCIFQYRFMGKWLCGIQHMKPMACKLWPFKVSERPTYGAPSKASFVYGGKEFYVYVDPLCRGISWGVPSRQFIDNVLPEFVEIGLGVCESQRYTTSQTLYRLSRSTKPLIIRV